MLTANPPPPATPFSEHACPVCGAIAQLRHGAGTAEIVTCANPACATRWEPRPATDNQKEQQP